MKSVYIIGTYAMQAKYHMWKYGATQRLNSYKEKAIKQTKSKPINEVTE